MSTLLNVVTAELATVDSGEAKFLSATIRDAIRSARDHGRFNATFHDYAVLAWREPLGARLVSVTWILRRSGRLIARDTAIQYY